MAVISPSITAETPDQYRQQIEKVALFLERVHLDFADGRFTPRKLLPLTDAWWPHSVTADIHLMYRQPLYHLPQVVHLRPHLAIVHAEAQGSFGEIARILRQARIKVGVALLQGTPVERIQPALDLIDHVLVFSGHLGHFGGEADLGLLQKVTRLKSLKPTLEVGWDGGINARNAARLVAGGVDVLCVGGHLQSAKDPRAAYATLKRIVGQAKHHETKVYP